MMQCVRVFTITVITILYAQHGRSFFADDTKPYSKIMNTLLHMLHGNIVRERNERGLQHFYQNLK